MSDYKLSAQITAGFSGLNTAFAGAQNAVKQGCSGIKTSLEGLSKPFEMVNVAMIAITTAAAGFGLGEMIKDVLDASNQVRGLKATFGGTVEEAERTRAELVHLGISTETYSGAALKLDRQLRTNEAGLRAIGVATRDGNGNFLDQRTVLQNALSTMMSYKEGTDRNAAAQMMFGRSASEVYPLLRMTGETAAQAAKDVEELGLSMDPALARKYQQAMGEMSLVFEGIKTKIAEAVLPALSDFATWFRSVGPQAIAMTQGVIKDLGEFLSGYILPVFKAVWDGVIHIGAVLVQSLGGWENTRTMLVTIATVIRDVLVVAINGLVFTISYAVTAIYNSWREIVDTVTVAVDLIKTEIGSWGTIMADVASGQWEKAKADYESGAHAVADTLRRYTSVMGQIGKEWADANSKNFKESIASMWGDGGIFGAPTGAPKTNPPPASAPKAGGSRYFLAPEKPDEAIKAAEETAQAHQRATQIEIQDKEAAVQQMRALDQISVNEEISQLTQLENQRHELVAAELRKELDLVKGKPAEYAKVNGQIEVAEAEHQAKLNAIARKGFSEQVSYLKEVWAPLTESFNSAVEGMMSGSETFWGAMKKGLASFLSQSIMANLKRLENWIFVEAAQSAATKAGVVSRTTIEQIANGDFLVLLAERIAGWLGFETAKTAETTVGAATRTAEEATASTASIIAAKAEALGEIPAYTGMAAMGAASAVAPIPIVGPALAAAAFGEMTALGASALAMASFDVGAWELPGDMIAKVHKGEMIIPAGPAAIIRSSMSSAGSGGASSGGSAGGDTHNWFLSAVDGKSLLRLMESQPKAFMAAARRNARDLRLAGGFTS